MRYMRSAIVTFALIGCSLCGGAAAEWRKTGNDDQRAVAIPAAERSGELTARPVESSSVSTAMLAAHNYWRQRLRLPQLAWSEELAR